jgi:hypothetical protein
MAEKSKLWFFDPPSIQDLLLSMEATTLPTVSNSTVTVDVSAADVTLLLLLLLTFPLKLIVADDVR